MNINIDWEGGKRELSDSEKELLASIVKSFLTGIEAAPKQDISLNFQEPSVPVTIFSKNLGLTESIVKYLHENAGMSLKEISLTLHKSHSNICTVYSKPKVKNFSRLPTNKNGIAIPLSIFRKDLSCFETIALFLKDINKLPFTRIGALLKRDPRTVWTIYQRARKKGGAL